MPEKYEQLVANIDGIVWEADARTFQFTFVSQQAERLLGYPLERWSEPGFWESCLHPDDRARAVAFCLEATRQKRKHELEYRMIGADGRIVWLRDLVSVVVEGGEPTLLRGIMIDVTERVRAEDALRASHNLLSAIFEATPDIVFVKDLQGRVLMMNSAGARLVGKSPDEVLGRDDTALHAPEEARKIQERDRHIMTTGAGETFEETVIVGGTAHVYLTTKDVYRDARGGVAGLLGIARDITERKRAEEERQAHLWFLESLDRVNRAIQGTNDLEQMMGAVLDAVLSIFACDRAWLVYPCDPGAATWTAPMERTRPEYPGALALGREVPMDPEVADVARLLLAAGHPVQFGPDREHPVPAAARAFGVLSFVATALHPKVDRPYMFGLHQCSHPRVWTPQEERLFQEIGRRLADALSNLLLVGNLRESERRLEEAERIAHVGYWERDFDGQRIIWSDETYRIFGLPPRAGTLTVSQVQERVHQEDWPVVAERVAEALSGGRRYDVEYRVIRPDGEVRVAHSHGDVVRDESGRPQRIFGTVQDITERKATEAALRESEERFRTFVDHATDAFFLQDDRGTVLDVNRQACASLGRTRAELIGMTPLDFDPDTQPGTVARIGARLDDGELVAFDARHRRADGTTFPVEVRIRPFWHGGRRFAVALARDMTERKRAEEALQRSEAYLAEAQRLSRTGSWAWSVTAREFVHWSQGHYRLHGLDPGAGTPSWEAASQMIHPDDRVRCLEQIERAVRDRTNCEMEYRAVLPDGTVKDIHSIAHPVFAAEGALVEFVGTEMDVTERKRAQSALTLFRSLIDHTTDVIEIVDPVTGQFLDVNEQACRTHGFTRAEYLALRVWDFEARYSDPGAWVRHVEDVRRTGSLIHEARHHRKDGSVFPVEVHVTYISLDRPYLLAVVRDITERKRTEEQLRQREDDLELALVAGRLGNWKWNVATGELTWSPLCKELYGLPPDAEVSYDRFVAAIHPDDRARVAQALVRALESGTDYEEEKRTVWPDGSVHWTASRGRVYRDASGRPLHMSGVTMDVTERKRAEDQLRASLQEKVVLLREVHHRVKNNLQLVSSLLALQASAIKDRAVKGALTESQNRVRAMALVHENLYRSRDLSSVRIAPHLEGLCTQLWRSYGVDPSRIALEVRIADLTVDLDLALRCGLIVNELVSNALKHAFPSARTGRVTVQLDHSPNGWYALGISDDGVGLPPGFEPGRADTLGLQLVADLTEQLNGTLALSRDGGTAVTVRFPQAPP
jgi:PAS domain S-box-containing protein